MLLVAFWLLFPSKLPASESHTNESPSYLFSWILIQTHRLHFGRYCKASGKKRYCQDSDCMHVEEHLLFSMNISASPGRDKAKLNCFSKGISENSETQNTSLPRFKVHHESTFKVWSFHFGPIHFIDTVIKVLFFFKFIILQKYY